MNKNLVTLERSNSIESELFKSLRTNMQFSLKKGQNIVMFTSSQSGDGKSLITSNLAVSITQLGKKVIVLDLDLRRRTQHKIFETKNDTGISTLINEESNFEDEKTIASNVMKAIKVTEIPNLFLIPAGPLPPNPSELLMNDNLGKLIEFLKNKFDYIIIDAPPVNVVTDATIIARQAEAIVLVVSVGTTKIRAIKEVQKALEKNNANIIGVVANRVPINKRSYKYKGYEYEYHQDTHPKKKK